METMKCIGPLHKGGEPQPKENFGINQKACRQCKAEYSRRRYAKQSDSILAKARVWKANNKPMVRAYNRAWQGLNPDKTSAYGKKYYSNHENRLAKNVINRIWSAFRIRIVKEAIPEYIGCSITEYAGFLEKRFTPGMGWKNYGFGKRFWEIDHFIPLSSFDKSDIEAIKKALHYENTRPLWGKDNRVKGAKLPLGLPSLPPQYGYNI